MTREEKQKAISALKKSAPVMAVTSKEYGDYIQTLNKIMDWLEQEPCEDWYDVSSDEMTLEQARQAVRELRKKLAEYLEQQPKPKIGHWIDDKCSVCGKGIEDLIDSREWYRNEVPKFCPFCGVRVVESEEES